MSRTYWFICESNPHAFNMDFEDLESAKEGIAEWHGSDMIEDTHVVQIYSYSETISQFDLDVGDFMQLELPYDEWNNPNYED